MNFWSALGKGLQIAAPIAAAPFTGGMSLAALAPTLIGTASKIASTVANRGGAAAGDVGRLTGAAAQGAADIRLTEAQINNQRDRNVLDRTATQIGQNQTRDAQALQRAQLGIEAPMARTKQAAYGDALSNVQDVNIDFQPTTGTLPKFNVSGGLRPSLFGANARGAGAELSRQALLKLMSGEDVPQASEAVAMPEMSDPTTSGAMEKTLGAAGLGGSILGALGDALKNRKPTMQQPMPTVGQGPQKPTGVTAFRPKSPELLIPSRRSHV